MQQVMERAAAGEEIRPPVLPDQVPMVRYLDPAAALACRTAVQDTAAGADGKAAALLTLLGMMFTIVGKYSGDLGAIFRDGGWLRFPAAVLVGGYALCAFSAVIQAFRTISPRFPKVSPSLAFFGDIVKLSREEYIAKVESLSPEEAMEHILRHNHTVSMICVEKFRQFKRGVRLFQTAFGFWVVLMAIVVTWGVMH